jgi:hypothetical protein
MIINKIISIIISITAILVIPVQIITTFVLGLLVSIPFVGFLLLLPISLVWVVLFWGPLLGLSYVYEIIALIRPVIAIIGIPLSVVGNTYVALMPSMGEMDSRYAKMVICQTFPYTWRFNQYENNKLNIGKDDVLTKILREVSRAKPLSKYLDGLRADVYERPDYMNGKYELDW